MKYLGEVKEVKEVVRKTRYVEYIRCDICNCKIKNARYGYPNYVRIHTWHSDWGNDSDESHEYKDLCKSCAASFVAKYIDEMDGTEELGLSHEHLSPWKQYDLLEDDGCSLAEDDVFQSKEEE